MGAALAGASEAGAKGVGIFVRTTYTPRAAAQAKRLRADAPVSEQRLWRALRALRLNIRRQAPFGRYIADFLHRGARLVIEVDGRRHDLPNAQLRDVERDAWIRSEGYEVLRVRDDDAYGRPDEVAAEIAGLISRRTTKDVSVPNGDARLDALLTPPSPTLPPLRGKGEI